MKTVKKSTSKKLLKKPLKKSVKKNSAVKKSAAALNSKRSRRILQVDVLDKILLKMAQKPYNKILNQLELGKKRLDEERRLALQLGTRILTKAKKVRDSLMSTKPTRS